MFLNSARVPLCSGHTMPEKKSGGTSSASYLSIPFRRFSYVKVFPQIVKELKGFCISRELQTVCSDFTRRYARETSSENQLYSLQI